MPRGRRRAHRHPRHRREEPGRDRPLAVEPQPDGRAGRQAVRALRRRGARLRRGVGRARPELRASRCWTRSREATARRSRFPEARTRSCAPSLDFDARFAASMKDRPVVLGYYFNFEERAVKANALPEPGAAEGHVRRPAASFSTAGAGYTGNLPIYSQSAARRRAHQSARRLRRRLRRVPLLARVRRRSTTRRCRSPMVRTCSRGRPARRSAGRAGFPGRPPERPGVARGRRAADPGRRERGRADPLSRREAAFRYVSLADVLRDRVAPERAEGQDRHRRHHRAHAAGHARDAGRRRLPGRGDPRQPDRRHPRRRGEAAAAVRGRRRGGAAADRRPRVRVLIPRLSALWATLATALGIGADRRVQLRGLDRAGWCCRSPPRCSWPRRSTS